MLDDVRRGELTLDMYRVFLEIHKAPRPFPDDAIHLLLYKREVAEINCKKLHDLPGEEWYSIAINDAGMTWDQAKCEALEVETGLLSVLQLKIGARVMCMSNIDVAHSLVNGTTGVVTNIYGSSIVQIRMCNTGKTFKIQPECRLTRNNGQEQWQFPLVLAWAITIHKCQSLTLSKAIVHLHNIFTSGQAYVALSQVHTRGDLFIEDWSLGGLLNIKHTI